MISLTDSAVNQLKILALGDDHQSKGLRISVESGGCAGMQYGMALDDFKPGDTVAERDGVRVLVDPGSVTFLNGSTIDYSDDLAGAGFRIQNPNAVRSCGCGTSFESAPGAVPSGEAH